MLCHTPLGEDGGVSGQAANRLADANQAFHAALVAGCKSPRLISLSRLLYDETEIIRRYLRYLNPVDHIRTSDEHQKIVDAALVGDVKQSVGILERHFPKNDAGTSRI